MPYVQLHLGALLRLAGHQGRCHASNHHLHLHQLLGQEAQKRQEEGKVMKQIVLCPIVIVTVDNDGKIFVDMNFSSSISEAMDDDGEFRDVTDDERIFIDDKVLPFITTSIDL